MRRIGRTIINPADGTPDDCAWDDCQKPLTTLWKVRIYEGVSPQWPHGPVYSWKFFCSNRHRMYYINAPAAHRQLPAGHRLSAI
jgi:hypothetical protein